MKYLIALAVLFGLYLSFPHLQKLLLGAVVDQKVEQLKDGMKESIPSVDPGLPSGSQELPVNDNVAGGEKALPLPIQ
jgi:hypothetical protein